MMQYTYFTFSTLFFLFLVSACSTNKLIKNNAMQSPTALKEEQSSKKILCVYKKEKGIAEVIAIKPDSYQFKFYLGDDIFEMRKDEILSKNELHIGDEFKAVKETTINKTKRHDCLPVNFHLIP